jgi:hypothetical protein
VAQICIQRRALAANPMLIRFPGMFIILLPITGVAEVHYDKD